MRKIKFLPDMYIWWKFSWTYNNLPHVPPSRNDSQCNKYFGECDISPDSTSLGGSDCWIPTLRHYIIFSHKFINHFCDCWVTWSNCVILLFCSFYGTRNEGLNLTVLMAKIGLKTIPVYAHSIELYILDYRLHIAGFKLYFA